MWIFFYIHMYQVIYMGAQGTILIRTYIYPIFIYLFLCIIYLFNYIPRNKNIFNIFNFFFMRLIRIVLLLTLTVSDGGHAEGERVGCSCSALQRIEWIAKVAGQKWPLTKRECVKLLLLPCKINHWQSQFEPAHKWSCQGKK